MASLLPDPVPLAEQLEHARGARDHLNQVIAWLEQGIELLGAGPPPPQTVDSAAEAERAPALEPGPAPPAAVKINPPRREGPRDHEARILSAIISSGRPVSKADIRERTGLTNGQIKSPLERLVRDGRVIAEGETVKRRYRSVDHEPHSVHGQRTSEGRKRNEERLTDAVARIGLRDRIINAVLADPGALTDGRLAIALDAHPDDVADACATLVTGEKLARGADSTYRCIRKVAA